jgi:hypothetical protein
MAQAKIDNVKVNVKYLRDRDREIVSGIFRNYEAPGSTLCFGFKAYKGDDLVKYTLMDGERYEIPIGVARHLNNTGFYPEYEFIQGEKGLQGAFSIDGQRMQVARKVKRYGFHSLEFSSYDDIGESNILEVTAAR